MRITPVHRLVAGAVVLAVVGAAAPVAAQEQSTGEPWRIVPAPQSSLVLARDGSLVGEIGRQSRTSVSIRTLPRYVGQAFIAVEDQRFYQHDGVDVIGIAGALKDAVRGDARGASTITQQLVGNMHPDIVDRTDRSLGRKLREQAAAREMEKHYTKEQILEGYLNYIHFGHGWYGVESAARHYFGKSAAALTLAEAATLAALPKGPALYDPITHPDRAFQRRNVVLDLMRDQKYISPPQADAAKREPVVTAPNAGYSVSAPYFVDVVRTQVERAGVPIASGGYRVYTTLDPGLEKAAAAALNEVAAQIESRPGWRHATLAAHAPGATDYLQGAVVAMQPASGDVLALVGGRDYRQSPFNRAVNALRQPGSSFKPIVYATALAAGVTPNAIVYDTALAIPLENHTIYRPENDDRRFLGPVTLREALTRSRNPVAVQLGLQLGMDTIIATARRLGISSPIAPYISSTIGASAVRPIDMVSAFTAFANLGARAEPRFIARVDDRTGRTVYGGRPAALHPALDPRVAFIVRDMMRDVVERGTATAVRRLLPDNIPVAGKTGTTNDNTDVWFLGMTPDVVGGVWLGFDHPQPIAPGAFGGTLAAPVFGRMMAQYYERHPAGAWTPPDGVVAVELDRASGIPADSVTPPERRYTEYFVEGTEPGAMRVDGWKMFRLGPIVP